MSTGVLVLTAEHKTALLELAAESIRTALVTGRMDPVGLATADGVLAHPAASFVTLERGDELLGCIGTLDPNEPLATGVARHAVSAAFADPRLPPVTPADYEVMSIKVSVLGELEPLPVTSLAELTSSVRAGIDGLVVGTAARRATLLPSVWEHVSGVGAFLAVLWQKAGLRPGTWPDGVRVDRYRTEEFGDPGPRPPI